MSAEWFLRLKEYDSLGKMRSDLIKSMEEQQKRVKNLQEKRQERLQDSEQLRSRLGQLQQDYHETEKKLKTSEEQARRLRDIGGDETKIKAFQTEATIHEDKLFILLEEIESQQAQMAEIKTFLMGLEKTLDEIQSEVQAIVEKSQQEITQLEFRMQLLQQELPDDFRGTLERTLKKNLAIGPFTRIEQGSCYFCRYKISRLEESEIDMQKQLKTCPQCSRIFLPYGS